MIGYHDFQAYHEQQAERRYDDTPAPRLSDYVAKRRAEDEQDARDRAAHGPTVRLPQQPEPAIAPPAPRKRRANVAARRKPAAAPVPPPPPPDTRSDLDRAVEQLVRQYTSGAVIDAAWEAAHRIFGVA